MRRFKAKEELVNYIEELLTLLPRPAVTPPYLVLADEDYKLLFERDPHMLFLECPAYVGSAEIRFYSQFQDAVLTRAEELMVSIAENNPDSEVPEFKRNPQGLN